jgi:hypothetical protein
LDASGALIPDKIIPAGTPLGKWRNRIVRSVDVSPDQLLANSRNWRIHPKNQQDALKGVLNSVGWVSRVIVQEGTDVVVDGHLRVALAISQNEPLLPVDYVDLDDDEVDLVLATYDPVAAMAVKDDRMYAELIGGIRSDDAALNAVITRLADDQSPGQTGLPYHDTEPPEDFASFDENLSYTHQCPSCGYKYNDPKGR